MAQVLTTLPQRELVNGMAEVVKAGAITSAALFDRVHALANDVLARQAEALFEVISAAIEVKVRVVEQDERESAVRAVLNAGHTIGHAVEALLQVIDSLAYASPQYPGFEPLVVFMLMPLVSAY